MKKFVKPLLIALAAATWLGSTAIQAQQNKAKDPLGRVKYDVKYLASDELEGRGVETEGIHKAADYIIAEFKKYGVKPGGKNNSYKQKFPVRIGRQIDKKNTSLVLKGPMDSKVKGKLGENFQAMMPGGDVELSDADLVFVGYGISSEDHSYDDFKDIDVDGKIVVMLTREPQADNEDSAFDGKKDTRHARLTTKLRNAKSAGAAGAIFINDAKTAGEKDAIPATNAFGSRFSRRSRVPFVMLKRKVFDTVLESSPLKTATGKELKSISDIEKHIDEKMEPVSQGISGWKGTLNTAFPSTTVDAFNIVGVVEGEGDKKDEVIVIGGHYDHLGKGPYGSRRPRSKEVHNGADDNATGTAAVIELARRFAKSDKKPKRTLVFVAFSGEERGLVGSNYWCTKEPLYPLEKTIAMINYDMIGWLRKGKLTIYGSGTCDEFDDALDGANEKFKLNLNKVPSPFAGSDHMPFNTKRIPCMFLHTGLTDTYHTPDDDYETLNMEGALKVIDYSEELLWKLDALDKKPKYIAPGRGMRRPRSRPSSDSKKSDGSKKADSAKKPSTTSEGGYMGVQLGDRDSKEVTVQSVTPNSAASKGGLRKGDIIVGLDGKDIKSNEDLIKAVGSKKAGEEVEVKLKRGETTITTKFKLGKRPADR